MGINPYRIAWHEVKQKTPPGLTGGASRKSSEPSGGYHSPAPGFPFCSWRLSVPVSGGLVEPSFKLPVASWQLSVPPHSWSVSTSS